MFIQEVFAASKENVVSANAMQMAWNASFVVKLVLLILVSFSVISWGIIIFKYFYIKKTKKSLDEFLSKFYDCTSLDSMFALATQHSHSILANIFIAAYQEMQKLAKMKVDFKNELDNINRAINKAHISEINKLEEFISFLGTTASATPFIGLFGTVWGIMNSFHDIGETGSANLATVAPGISEALITTALGLAAAIPAVVFYNYFLSKIKKLNSSSITFKADILNIVKRNF